MASMSRKQREDLAATRIMRVLSSLTMANQRTLEQKISDAGPYNQRIDPHVLNDVRKQLLKEGQIARVVKANAPWHPLALRRKHFDRAAGRPNCRIARRL